MQIIRERRWKEVTAVFNFPSTATNASFVLRKYYISLLHHYEQIYFFKARGWIPMSNGTSTQQSVFMEILIIGFSFIIQQSLADCLMSPPITPVPASRTDSLQPTPEIQAGKRINTAELAGGLYTFLLIFNS